MNQIYQNTGLVELLKRMANPSTRWHLYENNVTPTRDSVLGDFTEATFIGGTTYLLVPADFSVTGVAAYVGSIIAAPVSYVNTSGSAKNAYGYYVTDTASAILLAAARFDGAPISRGDGQAWVVTPRLGDFSRFSS